MSHAERHPLISGAKITGLGTLFSRLLGMVRDVTTAAMFGLTTGGVMDAFVIAFRIPNLFRRLFGEGALTASYLPIFTRKLEEDRLIAWKVASVTLTLLTGLLVVVVVVAELVCLVLALWYRDDPSVGLVVGLAALMMPYLLFICVAAQLSATLHALGHFAVPALVSSILNICWLVALWVVAPWASSDKLVQVHILAAGVLVAGIIQGTCQLPVIRRLGGKYNFDWAASRASVVEMIKAMAPMMIGLAITQINTFTDSILAWVLSADLPAGSVIGWLPGEVAYPMRQGATSAIYYAERLYQFPTGILGLAVATAIFPLLSRHAARGRHDLLGADLTLGLRIVLFLAVPAGVGLILLADPIAQLLFQRGEFTPADSARTARLIGCYGIGVWAFCALPVVVRGYYAVGDRNTPVRVGVAMVGVNLLLNLVLVWPLAEAGLALSTALVAGLQVLLLLIIFSRRSSRVDWREVMATCGRTALATLIMAVGVYLALGWMPPGSSLTLQVLRVVGPCVLAVAIFLGAALLMRQPELSILYQRSTKGD
jgi:putative peptidoglycan lipid II flippase